MSRGKSGVLKPSACRPYVRPWADDDDDDDAIRCHGDDVITCPSDVIRRPLGVVSSNFINTLPSDAGIYALFFTEKQM